MDRELLFDDVPAKVVKGIYRLGDQLGIENVLPELKVLLPRATSVEALADLKVGDIIELGDYSIIPAGILGDKHSFRSVGMNKADGFKTATVVDFMYEGIDKVGVFVHEGERGEPYLVSSLTGIIAKDKDKSGFFSPHHYDKGISLAYRKSREDPNILNNLKSLRDRIRKTNLPVAGIVNMLVGGLAQLFGKADKEVKIYHELTDLLTETFAHPTPKQTLNPSIRLGEVTTSFYRHAFTTGIYSMLTEEGVRFFRVAEKQVNKSKQIAIQFFFFDEDYFEDRISLKLDPNLRIYYLPEDVIPVSYFSGGISEVEGYLKEAKEVGKKLANLSCTMFLELLIQHRSSGR